MKVFIAHSMRDQEVTLAPADAMRAQGYEPIDPLSMIRAGDLLSQVSTLIRSADAFVAILTERNANVYYELGLATGDGKPVVILAPPGEPLVSDLAAMPKCSVSKIVSWFSGTMGCDNARHWGER